MDRREIVPRTFKTGLLRKMERCVLPADRIFGITSTRRHHLMERSNPIARFEFGNIISNGVDHACDVIPLVDRFRCRLSSFPVLP